MKTHMKKEYKNVFKRKHKLTNILLKLKKKVCILEIKLNQKFTFAQNILKRISVIPLIKIYKNIKIIILRMYA